MTCLNQTGTIPRFEFRAQFSLENGSIWTPCLKNVRKGMPGPAAASKLRSHILSAVGRRKKILVWIPRRSDSERRGIKLKSFAGPYNSAKAAECLHFHIGSRTRASHASKERSRLPRCRAPARGAAAGPSSSHKLIVFPGMQLGSARRAHGQPCRISRGCVSLGSKARLFAMLAADACRVAADRRRSHRLYDAPSLVLPKRGETIAPVGSQFQVSLWVNM